MKRHFDRKNQSKFYLREILLYLYILLTLIQFHQIFF